MGCISTLHISMWIWKMMAKEGAVLLDANYRELGQISAAELESLQQAVQEAPPAEWDSETRQRYFKAHQHTSSIILCFGPDDDLKAADYTPYWPRWKPLLGDMIERITAAHFGGGKLIRLMIVRLYAGCSVLPHTDDLPILHVTHRVHIPIKTSSSVVFIVGGQVVPMSNGAIVEINNQRFHSVLNIGSADRDNLIFDFATDQQLQQFCA